MIVKILSSAGNFEGIDYSERKNDLGKSQLLKAWNFGALGHQAGKINKSDYINYMKLICDANPRVKKRQFHAVISAKGYSYTPEELGNMAENYLKSMGYGDNPYLIYYHSDTNNNHVHLVSTRVDKNGKKVDDSYEKIRSQKVLQEILNQDPKVEAKNVMDQALAYNFSTKSQFKLLLEQQGFKNAEKEGQIEVIKYGIAQAFLPSEQVDLKVAQYIPPEDRIRQLKAIFSKYKYGLEAESFQKKMHQKFGIELVFHRGKNQEKPYGYTIFDHMKKQVMKGSQIMPIAELLLPASREERNQLLHGFIEDFNFDHETFHAVKQGLASIGFQINQQGEISAVENPDILKTLDNNQIEQLKYNSRVALASNYVLQTDYGKKLLSLILNIRSEDISNLTRPTDEAKQYYMQIMLSTEQSKTLNEILKSKKMEVIQFKGKLFLLDQSNKYIFEFNRLLDGQELDLKGLSINNLDQPQKHSVGHSIDRLGRIFEFAIIEAEHENRPKKRKKRSF